MDNQNNKNKNKNQKNNKQGWGIILFTTLMTLFLVLALYQFMPGSNPKEITYDQFLKMVDEGKVAKVKIGSDKIEITPKKKNSNDNKDTELMFPSVAPKYYTGVVKDDTLSERLYKAHVKYSQDIPDSGSEIFWNIMLTLVLPTLLLFGVFSFFMRKMSKGGGMMGIGKSNAKMYVEKQTGVTFKDVAGQDEAKESLQEVVDFLHNPGKYTSIGAKLPKGALLVRTSGNR